MNKATAIPLVLMISLASLVGCGKSASQSVKLAVSDNQNAETISEWQSSEAHPDFLFNQWREEETSDDKIAQAVCEALTDLDEQSLTIFEENIELPENAQLLARCGDVLKIKLEKYYQKQREKLEVPVNAKEEWVSSSNAFKFPLNTQMRDLSKGYKAVTGDVGAKEVVLTFDDGPSGQYTDSILRSLKEVNAKAIFFSLGKNVMANPEIVKRVAADGHAIGSHSMTHACLGSSRACKKTNGYNLSFDQAAAEIREAHQTIYNVLGWVDPFFRFPYGESSAELTNFLKRNHVGEFFWAIDSNDWKAQSNQAMINSTIAQVEARGRGVILFHDIQRKTAESLPQFLRELYKRGYSIVLLQASDANLRYNSPLVKKNRP